MAEYTIPGTSIDNPTKDTDKNTKSSRKLVTAKTKDTKQKTITGASADTIILNPVMEAVDNTKAVVAFGRHQPFTNGHKNVLDTVESEAQKQGAQAHFITSHSEETGKNPISAKEKVKLIGKVAKPTTKVYSSDSESPSILHQLSSMHHAGVKHITYVGGSDRVKGTTDLIKKYNGVKGKHGYYKFDTIDSASSGHRDPDAEGTEGVSGTKVRAMARAGDEKKFKEQIPKELHPHAKEIMKSINQFNEQMEVLEDIEEILENYLSELDRSNTHLRDQGTSSLTTIYKNDTPGQGVNMDYKLRFKDPKEDKEAMTRSGQKRIKIDMVPRKDPSRDRHIDGDFYRQQEIAKKIVDEAKKSPVDKIFGFKKFADSEARAQKAKKNLEQAGKDYQDILDKEAQKKKTNEAFSEAVNSSGGGSIRGLGVISGSGDNDSSDPYLDANIANADTRDNIMAGHVQDHSDMHTAGSATVVKASATPTADPDRELDKASQLTSTQKLAVNGISDQVRASVTKEEKVWDKPNPNKTHHHLSPDQKARAKARAKAAGRPYPNLIDNMAVAKEETINEIGDTPAGQNALKKTFYRASNRSISASGEGLIGHLSGENKKALKYNNEIIKQTKKRIKDSKFFEDATTEKDPLKHLEDRLNTATDTSHNGIDKLMREVARDFNMNVHDLHDKWVEKYKITPDQYVKEDYQTPVTKGKLASPEHFSAIKDIALNTKNRNLTIKEYSYGPMDPNDEKNNVQFWKDKADMWNTTVEAAKEARCGNCAVFNQSPKVLKMIEDAIGENGSKVQKEANLGFCELFEFKCAAARTCDAWIMNGPLKEEVNDMFEEFSGCFIDIESDVSGIVEEVFNSSGDELYEDWGELNEEAEHNGRHVKLGKPFLTPGGPKKRAVYVKNDKGNVVKVNFGDPHLSIKRDQPNRRKSYRARHHCETPGPRWKANYWSCKYWSSTPTSTLDKG